MPLFTQPTFSTLATGYVIKNMQIADNIFIQATSFRHQINSIKALMAKLTPLTLLFNYQRKNVKYGFTQ